MIEVYVHEKLSPRSVIVVFSVRTGSLDEERGPRFCLEEDGRLAIWEDNNWKTLYQSLQENVIE